MTAQIVNDEMVYKRYISVWNRTTQFPDESQISWDIAGHAVPDPAFVTVFPFDSQKVRFNNVY